MAKKTYKSMLSYRTDFLWIMSKNHSKGSLYELKEASLEYKLNKCFKTRSFNSLGSNPTFTKDGY